MGDFEVYGTSTFAGLTPSGSAISPGTLTESLSVPLRTVLTEERVTTTRYCAPHTPPGSDYQAADSGTASYDTPNSGTTLYGTTSSDSDVSAPGSSQSSTAYSTPESSTPSFVTAKSIDESEYISQHRPAHRRNTLLRKGAHDS